MKAYSIMPSPKENLNALGLQQNLLNSVQNPLSIKLQIQLLILEVRLHVQELDLCVNLSVSFFLESSALYQNLMFLEKTSKL